MPRIAQKAPKMAILTHFDLLDSNIFSLNLVKLVILLLVQFFQLLLATDRSVSAVILCKSAPTKPMLAQLHVDARSRIKELDSNYDTL